MQKIETFRQEEQQPSADTKSLRKHVKKQLEDIEVVINRLTKELESATEFRSRCFGGLETLQVLDPVEETESSGEEEPSDTDDTSLKLN